MVQKKPNFDIYKTKSVIRILVYLLILHFENTRLFLA